MDHNQLAQLVEMIEEMYDSDISGSVLDCIYEISGKHVAHDVMDAIKQRRQYSAKGN